MFQLSQEFKLRSLVNVFRSTLPDLLNKMKKNSFSFLNFKTKCSQGKIIKVCKYHIKFDLLWQLNPRTPCTADHQTSGLHWPHHRDPSVCPAVCRTEWSRNTCRRLHVRSQQVKMHYRYIKTLTHCCPKMSTPPFYHQPASNRKTTPWNTVVLVRDNRLMCRRMKDNHLPCLRRTCFSGNPSTLWKTFLGLSLERSNTSE